MDSSTSAVLVLANKIIDGLLDSSSSSEDEDDEFIAALGIPVPPRVKNFAETALHIYTANEFMDNFGMSRETFRHLVKLYSNSYDKRIYQGGKKQLKPEIQLLLFLWFSVHKTIFRETSSLFDISISTMHKTFSRVLKFFSTDILNDTITFPHADDEKEAIAIDFEDIAGFPNVLGCVTRCLIPVKTVTKSETAGPLLMQAICDAHCRFLHVSCTDLSNIPPDSEIINPSLIGNDLSKICSPQYHLLADNNMYALNEYILTPYPDDENLSESERNFNRMFHQTCDSRMRSIRVFRSRFRQLTKTLEFRNVETMFQFVKSCCVIHNICLSRGDFPTQEIQIDYEIDDIQKYPPINSVNIDKLEQLGHIKRNEIKEHLINLTKY